MSPLAWKILVIIKNAAKRSQDEPELWTGYIPGWVLNERLGDVNANINGVDVKYPHNEYQQAMKELVDLGLIREKPDLPERFDLVVKEPVKDVAMRYKIQEQPEPVQPAEPTVATYWTQPPNVQGKIREKVDLDELLSDL